ncbi:MAG: hypothetical protein DLM63_06695 [Solirubrobacterales bacterium]|nr:MAG: hypothetical protein DLM63_06695 [Solirubrobacterales bacterium]
MDAPVDVVGAGQRSAEPVRAAPSVAVARSAAGDRGGPRQFSDPNASWGHRSAISTRKGGGFYGYKIHAAVDVATDLPLAWTVQPAKESEHNFARMLVTKTMRHGFNPRTLIADKGYDGDPLQRWCMDEGIAPVIALKDTATVRRGGTETPCCEHGQWVFSGADYKRKATKWRCPTGVCTPASVWIKADRLHPLIPRESKRFKDLYRSRGAVEREFGRLKHEWALLPLRVRGIERVRLHADLTILAKLTCALARTRTVAVAA